MEAPLDSLPLPGRNAGFDKKTLSRIPGRPVKMASAVVAIV